MGKKSSSTPDFVRMGAVGLDELADSGSSKFLKLKAGKAIEVVPLTGVEGILSFNQHALWLDEGNSPIWPCFGKPWCPGEIIGDKARFRALLLVVTKDDPDTEMILPMGSSMFKQMVAVEDAIGGSMKGQVIRVLRTGEGLATKYNIIPTGRRIKVTGDPDTNLMEHIGPTTPEEVIEMLEKAGKWTDDHQEEYDRLRLAAKKRSAAADDDDDEDDDEEETPAPTKKSKKSPPPPVDDDDEDDLADDDEEDEEETPPPAKKKTAKPAAKSAAKKSKKPVDEDDDFEDVDEE